MALTKGQGEILSSTSASVGRPSNWLFNGSTQGHFQLCVQSYGLTSPQTLHQQPSWDSWLFSCPVGQLFKGAVGKTWSKQSCNYFYNDLFKEVWDSRGRSGEGVVADWNGPPRAEITSTPAEEKKQAVSCLPQSLPSSAFSNCLQTTLETSESKQESANLRNWRSKPVCHKTWTGGPSWDHPWKIRDVGL